MGERAATALSRLRTCRDAGLPVPVDLHDELIALLAATMSAEERQQQRNRDLRIAALLLPADLPLWTRARLLHQEALSLARSRRDSSVDPVRDRLRIAALYASLPGCQKQYARILAEDPASWTSNP